MEKLPNMIIGNKEAFTKEWRNYDINNIDDDEELEKTPEDVVEMLGFDPKELNEK